MDTGYQSYTWRRDLILRLLKKYLMASAVLLGVLLGFEQLAGAQQVALRSNVLNDVLLTPDIGREVIVKFADKLSDVASITEQPKLEGRTISLVVAPKK